MADSKLSALSAAGAYDDADLLYIVQGGVSYKTTYGALKAAIMLAKYPEVANFAALPAAGDHTGETYVCLAAQGTYFINRKPSGFYYSDGASWTYVGELPEDYFTDSILQISDDADPTKICKFQLSSISAGTTRTLTVPDASGTIMLVGNAPTAHKTSHENGGSDEISVAGLSGVLADPQPPIIGAGAGDAVAGNDARLTDERVPTAAGLTTKFGTNKASLVDGDKVSILDSAASDVPKHALWSLVKSTLKTYFDTLYQAAITTLGVVNGGTGVATTTAYSPIFSGTTATGAFKADTGPGTSGHVLTSNGAGAYPTWQAAASGGGVQYFCYVGTGLSLGDTTTYYYANNTSWLAATPNVASIIIPRSGNITRVEYNASYAAAGSNEDVNHYVRINDTTDTCNAVADYDSANLVSNAVWTGTQAVTAGDRIIIKVVTPAWGTNPTTIKGYAVIFFAP